VGVLASASSLPGLWLRSRYEDKDSPRRRVGEEDELRLALVAAGETGGVSFGLKEDCWVTSLKMWIVSVALETERREEVELKDMQYI
jgi:hypothetical protein